MTVSVFQATIVNREGTVQASASVEVRDESDNSLATIYSDRAGTTPLSNPTTTDANGFVRFYAGPGAYKITATKSGQTTTWRHVALGLGREHDSDQDTETTDSVEFANLTLDGSGSRTLRLQDNVDSEGVEISSGSSTFDAAAIDADKASLRIYVDGNTTETMRITKNSVLFYDGAADTENARITSLGLSFDAGTNNLDSLVNWTNWTPEFIGTTVAGANTYTTQEGRYNVVNNVCTIFINLYSAIGGFLSTGEIRINLPLTPASGNPSVMACTIGNYADMNITSGNTLMAHINESIAQILLLQGSNTGSSVLTNAQFGSRPQIILTAQYEVA